MKLKNYIQLNDEYDKETEIIDNFMGRRGCTEKFVFYDDSGFTWSHFSVSLDTRDIFDQTFYIHITDDEITAKNNKFSMKIQVERAGGSVRFKVNDKIEILTMFGIENRHVRKVGNHNGLSYRFNGCAIPRAFPWLVNGKDITGEDLKIDAEMIIKAIAFNRGYGRSLMEAKDGTELQK